MPYKDKEKQREAQRAYAKRNKEKQYEQAKLRKQGLREWFEKYKGNHPCACGESHPACIEFHHDDEDDKFACVSHMVYAGYAKERILQEIEKCTVFCSNCHRKLHYNEKSGNKTPQRHTKGNQKRLGTIKC